MVSTRTGTTTTHIPYKPRPRAKSVSDALRTLSEEIEAAVGNPVEPLPSREMWPVILRELGTPGSDEALPILRDEDVAASLRAPTSASASSLADELRAPTTVETAVALRPSYAAMAAGSQPVLPSGPATPTLSVNAHVNGLVGDRSWMIIVRRHYFPDWFNMEDKVDNSHLTDEQSWPSTPTSESSLDDSELVTSESDNDDNPTHPNRTRTCMSSCWTSSLPQMRPRKMSSYSERLLRPYMPPLSNTLPPALTSISMQSSWKSLKRRHPAPGARRRASASIRVSVVPTTSIF